MGALGSLRLLLGLQTACSWDIEIRTFGLKSNGGYPLLPLLYETLMNLFIKKNPPSLVVTVISFIML